MKNWLKRLFHWHQWVMHERAQLSWRGQEVGALYVMRCSECGKIKTVKVGMYG